MLYGYLGSKPTATKTPILALRGGHKGIRKSKVVFGCKEG